MHFPVALLLLSCLGVLAVSAQAQVNSNSFIKCDPYSASLTDSANQNYVTCQIDNVCPGVKLAIGDCSSSCSGDQYIRLFDASNTNQLAGNDDGACESPLNLCSSMDYSYNDNALGCVSMVLRQGCYDTGSCSGRVKVNYIYTATPTYAPSALPTTAPSSRPTPTPSYSPTAGVMLSNSDTVCAAYVGSHTDKARSNYAVCNFQLCPGTVVTIGDCDGSCSGDQFIRLFDGSNNLVMYDDDGCASDPYALCSQLTYVYRSGLCQTFSLHQGCYGDESCGGTMAVVKTSTPAPSSLPTAIPTAKPSSTPTLSPTTAPTSVPTTKPSAEPSAQPTTKPSAIPTLAPTQMPFTGFALTNINELTAVQQSMWYRSKFIGVVYTFNDCSFNLADDAACAARYPGAEIMTMTVNGFPAKFAMTAELRAPSTSPTSAPSSIPTAKPTTGATILPTNSPTGVGYVGSFVPHGSNSQSTCVAACASIFGGGYTYRCSWTTAFAQGYGWYSRVGYPGQCMGADDFYNVAGYSAQLDGCASVNYCFRV